MKNAAMKIFILLSVFTVFSCSAKFDNVHDPYTSLDECGVFVSQRNVSVVEGELATFTVALTSPSINNVTIDLAAGMPAGLTVSPETLVFLPENYDKEQTVTLTATDNDLAADASQVLTLVVPGLESSDPDYRGRAFPSITVIVNDDDSRPAVTGITPSDGDMSASVREKVILSFSKAMDEASLASALTLTEEETSSAVTGTVEYTDYVRNGRAFHRAAFTPRGILKNNISYRVTLTADARDSAGNAPAGEQVFIFKTGLITGSEEGQFRDSIASVNHVALLDHDVLKRDLAFICDNDVTGACELRVVDVSDVRAPFDYGIYSHAGYAGAGTYEYTDIVVDTDRDLALVSYREMGSFPDGGLLLYSIHAVSESASFFDNNTVVDQVVTGGSPAWDICFHNGYFYLAGESGLKTVAVTGTGSSATAAVVGSLDPGECRNVVCRGDYAYVIKWDEYGNESLVAVDISDPASPSLVAGSECELASDCTDMVINGNYLYIADEKSGVIVVDITDPASPQKGVTLPLASMYESRSLTLKDNRLFVVNGYSSIKIYDTGDPSHPVIAGSVLHSNGPLSGQDPRNLAIFNGNIFLANEKNGLRILDLSDPALPSVAGTVATSNARSVVMRGIYGYVANSHESESFPGGIDIINVIDPSSPLAAGSWTSGDMTSVTDLERAGDYLYTVNNGKLDILGISDDTTLSSAGNYTSEFDSTGPEAGPLLNVSVTGERVYLSGYVEGGNLSSCGFLEMADVSDVASPAYLGSYDELTPYDNLGNGVSDIVVLPGHERALAADGLGGLKLVDISEPANCTLAGVYETKNGGGNNDARGLFLTPGEGDGLFYIYVADTVGGLSVYRYKAGDPVVKMSWVVPNDDRSNLTGACAVCVKGNYAYVCHGIYGIKIVDISGSGARPVVAECDTPQDACDISVSGNYAYVADSTGGLCIIHLGKFFEGAPVY